MTLVSRFIRGRPVRRRRAPSAHPRRDASSLGPSRVAVPGRLLAIFSGTVILTILATDLPPAGNSLRRNPFRGVLEPWEGSGGTFGIFQELWIVCVLEAIYGSRQIFKLRIEAGETHGLDTLL